MEMERKKVIAAAVAAFAVSAAVLVYRASAREILVLSDQQAQYVEVIRSLAGDTRACKEAGVLYTADSVLAYSEELGTLVYATCSDCRETPRYVDMLNMSEMDQGIVGSAKRYIVTDKDYGVFTFESPGEWSVAVTDSSGESYELFGVWENISVTENLYLSSNSHVEFTSETSFCQAAERIAGEENGDWNRTVDRIQDFVAETLEYDQEECERNYRGRWSNLEEVYESGKGICTDYAAAMAAMCRYVGIPAKYVVGMVSGAVEGGYACHAWVEVLSSDGSEWIRFDPTFYDGEGGVYLPELYGYETLDTM